MGVISSASWRLRKRSDRTMMNGYPTRAVGCCVGSGESTVNRLAVRRWGRQDAAAWTTASALVVVVVVAEFVVAVVVSRLPAVDCQLSERELSWAMGHVSGSVSLASRYLCGLTACCWTGRGGQRGGTKDGQPAVCALGARGLGCPPVAVAPFPHRPGSPW